MYSLAIVCILNDKDENSMLYETFVLDMCEGEVVLSL